MNAEAIKTSASLSQQEQAAMEDLATAVAKLELDTHQGAPTEAAEVAAQLLALMTQTALLKAAYPAIHDAAMLLIAAVMVDAGLIDIEAIEGEQT
ncbi:hypothetical protein [Crenobacter caeni]|uniref:DUF4404 family protein n=1 Tax=Crenobacter caeni TaxID=2705474 RepID=A0A6B2KN88_9NEIS|nr:hypothetical protein [Crenobacter caeni]NDV11645.1 hypothetical protein [Crenobacter caeni]